MLVLELEDRFLRSRSSSRSLSLLRDVEADEMTDSARLLPRDELPSPVLLRRFSLVPVCEDDAASLFFPVNLFHIFSIVPYN